MADEKGLDDEPGEQADHHHDADEAELFGDDGEQEVGMRLGQIEKLLHAAAQPQPQPFAATESDQRMRQLVTLAVRVGERIHEAEHALQAVRRRPDENDEADQQHHHQPGEHPPVESAEEQDAHGDRHDHHEGAEVGFAQQQAAGQDHHCRHRQEALLEVVHERSLARGVVGGVEHGEEFHQLGRLQVGEAERDPAAAAVHFTADPGDQHHHQQQQAGEEEVGRGLLPDAHRYLEGSHGEGETDADEDRLADEVELAVVPGVPGRLGGGNRGRIDHHQTDRQQGERQPQQAEVEL